MNNHQKNEPSEYVKSRIEIRAGIARHLGDARQKYERVCREAKPVVKQFQMDQTWAARKELMEEVIRTQGRTTKKAVSDGLGVSTQTLDKWVDEYRKELYKRQLNQTA